MNGGGRWLPSYRPESRIEHGWDAAWPCKISTANKKTGWARGELIPFYVQPPFFDNVPFYTKRH